MSDYSITFLRSCITHTFLDLCRGKKFKEAYEFYTHHPDMDISDNDFITIVAVGCDLPFMQWLLEMRPHIDVCTHNYFAFRSACKNKNIPMAKWLLEIRPDTNILYGDNDAFKTACLNCNFDVAEWLLQVHPILDDPVNSANILNYFCFIGNIHHIKWLLNKKPDINVSTDDEFAFRWSCSTGKLDIAQLLLEVNPSINIYARDDYAFRYACNYGRLDVAQWLVSLDCIKYSIMFGLYEKMTPVISENYDYSKILYCLHKAEKLSLFDATLICDIKDSM